MSNNSYRPTSDPAVQLMQDRLAGTERDTGDLAKMLVDLGITPTPSPDWAGAIQSPDFLKMTESTLKPEQDGKSKEKHVKFDVSPPEKLAKSSSLQSILKKAPIKPLQVNFNAANVEENPPPMSSNQYSKMVNRLCRTESVIQSLKQTLSSMKAKHDSANQEKTLVIDKLKEEIREQDKKVKSQERDLVEEGKRREDAERRWKEAEKQIADLHLRVEELNKKSYNNSKEDDTIKEKYARRIEEAKIDIAREKEVREVIENSHIALLSRVHDMEEAITHERNQVEHLSEENKRLRETNTNYLKQSTEWTEKASNMETILSSFKKELDAKEEAIRRLVDEQQQNEKEGSELASKQDSLHRELKQCNILLDAQKAAFTQLEDENKNLQTALEEERGRSEELDEKSKEINKQEKEMKLEEEIKIRSIEDRMKSEMRQAVNKVKRKADDAEARIKLLEECIKKQEGVLRQKDSEFESKEKEADKLLFEERKKTDQAIKERDQAIKSKESVMKDLNKAASDVNRDKEYLQQQLEEIKLEQEVTLKEKQQLENENHRLMDRISLVEHQEAAFNRAQDLAAAANSAKSQLSYENGKLQTRVEQLEEELRSLASVQSQVVQLRATNRALEQKYSQMSTELASSRVDSGRTNAHIKQLQNGMSRKEADFNLAIAARDEAVKEKDAVLAQVDAIKEQERIRSAQLQRDFNSCRADNERLSSTVNEIASRLSNAQEKLNEVQSQLGRKDAQVSALLDEREKCHHQLNDFQTTITHLETQLHERDADEHARISPALNALEQARHENVRLAGSLDDVLHTNAQLKEDLDKYRTDLEIQREKADMLTRQQEAHEDEVSMTARNQTDRLQQMKAQFAKERSAIKRQMHNQIAEIKKTNEATQSRNTQLTRGNSELRSKISNHERVITKLKEKVKQQKHAIERQQTEKKSSYATENKLKEIDNELEGLEKTKQNYIKKNEEQATVIATFNSEVASLKEDIAALSHAQKIARDTSLKLEEQVNKERAEKELLIAKITSLDGALKHAISEKQIADEKLRKVQIESIHVQQNLQQAQTWFKDKFEVLQNEISQNGDRVPFV
uniref:Myoplasmin-C1 n=1 Tax=Phallusia mammillata TaxID=59560 RepID=A0A6F9D7R8_9ASCI|nr:myoplasmin-C1 [Phallusia mammillata]